MDLWCLRQAGLAGRTQTTWYARQLFGTDALGRDLAARATYGIRISLIVAISVTALAVVLGMGIGLVAGYVKGRVDSAISLVVDFVWGFPLILVAVLAAASIGSGLLPVILAVGLVNTVAIARVVRGEVLGLTEKDFVIAAHAGGYSTSHILLKHIIPNVMPVAFVLSSYYVAVAIIAEASLSFVGLGRSRQCQVWVRWFQTVEIFYDSTIGNPLSRVS